MRNYELNSKVAFLREVLLFCVICDLYGSSRIMQRMFTMLSKQIF